jgi:hypothetical protein
MNHGNNAENSASNAESKDYEILHSIHYYIMCKVTTIVTIYYIDEIFYK